MTVSDGSLGLAALVVSLLLHGLLFFHSGSPAGNEERATPQRSVTRVSFRSVASPQAAAKPVHNTPEVPPEQEVTEARQAPPKPQPPKPEQHAARAQQPEPLPAQRQPVAEPVATSAETSKQPVAAEAARGSVDDPALIERVKQEYLRRLMAHIEGFKHYPRAARRRGIQGDVAVAFTLNKGGQVHEVEAEGAHRLLLAAAGEAVDAAQPLPEPPPTLTLPWKVSFTMRFTLR